jgi:hypothetical protein
MPYRGDLGQFLVVGLAQHPLLERIQERSAARRDRGPGVLCNNT